VNAHAHNCTQHRKDVPTAVFDTVVSNATRQKMRLSAAAFILYSTRASLEETWNVWTSVAGIVRRRNGQEGAEATGLADCLCDPYPALRFLFSLDAGTTLRVLRDGLAGWDALEGDLVEELSQSALAEQRAQRHRGAGSAGGLRTITQAVVDAVVALLEEESASSVSSENLIIETEELQFLAEHLASNRVAVKGEVLLRVLSFLATGSAAPAGRGRRYSQYAPVSGACGLLTVKEREATFKDVVTHVEDIPPDALSLARAAGFAQAEARIHHRKGEFTKALACLATDTRHPAAPFRYLRDLLEDPTGVTGAERAAFQDAAVRLMPKLVRLDPKAVAATVAQCLGDRQNEVLEALETNADDQFAFLQAAVELQRAVDVGGHGSVDDVPMVSICMCVCTTNNAFAFWF